MEHGHERRIRSEDFHDLPGGCEVILVGKDIPHDIHMAHPTGHLVDRVGWQVDTLGAQMTVHAIPFRASLSARHKDRCHGVKVFGGISLFLILREFAEVDAGPQARLVRPTVFLDGSTDKSAIMKPLEKIFPGTRPFQVPHVSFRQKARPLVQQRIHLRTQKSAMSGIFVRGYDMNERGRVRDGE